MATTMARQTILVTTPGAASPAAFETAINAALAPLTSHLIGGWEAQITDKLPTFVRNLRAVLDVDDTGTPGTAFQVKVIAGPDEATVKALFIEFETANPTWFYAPGLYQFSDQLPNIQDRCLLFVLYNTSSASGNANWQPGYVMTGGGGAPSGPAGGDLSGAYPNPGVAGWRGIALAAGMAAPTNGDYPLLVGGVWTNTPFPSSLPPSGAAGGDLAGTYPSPTLAAIGAATGPIGNATTVPVVTIDAKGRVTALTSTTISGVSPGGAAGGDLAGTYPSPTLAAIGAATGPIGSATTVPVVTIDTKGRVTGLTSASIAVPIQTGLTAWVDSVYGNDGTAIFQRQDRPYLTIAAASAAVSGAGGGTVRVRPGTYTETANIAYDLVKIECDQGVTIANVTTAIAADGGVDMTFSLVGNPFCTCSAAVPGTFDFSGAGSFITLELDSITSANNTTATVRTANLCILYLDCVQGVSATGSSAFEIASEPYRINLGDGATGATILSGGAGTFTAAWTQEIIASGSIASAFNNNMGHVVTVAGQVGEAGSTTQVGSSSGADIYHFGSVVGPNFVLSDTCQVLIDQDCTFLSCAGGVGIRVKVSVGGTVNGMEFGTGYGGTDTSLTLSAGAFSFDTTAGTGKCISVSGGNVYISVKGNAQGSTTAATAAIDCANLSAFSQIFIGGNVLAGVGRNAVIVQSGSTTNLTVVGAITGVSGVVTISMPSATASVLRMTAASLTSVAALAVSISSGAHTFDGQVGSVSGAAGLSNTTAGTASLRCGDITSTGGSLVANSSTGAINLAVTGNAATSSNSLAISNTNVGTINAAIGGQLSVAGAGTTTVAVDCQAGTVRVTAGSITSNGTGAGATIKVQGGGVAEVVVVGVISNTSAAAGALTVSLLNATGSTLRLTAANITQAGSSGNAVSIAGGAHVCDLRVGRVTTSAGSTVVAVSGSATLNMMAETIVGSGTTATALSLETTGDVRVYVSGDIITGTGTSARCVSNVTTAGNFIVACSGNLVSASGRAVSFSAASGNLTVSCVGATVGGQLINHVADSGILVFSAARAVSCGDGLQVFNTSGTCVANFGASLTITTAGEEAFDVRTSASLTVTVVGDVVQRAPSAASGTSVLNATIGGSLLITDGTNNAVLAPSGSGVVTLRVKGAIANTSATTVPTLSFTTLGTCIIEAGSIGGPTTAAAVRLNAAGTMNVTLTVVGDISSGNDTITLAPTAGTSTFNITVGGSVTCTASGAALYVDAAGGSSTVNSNIRDCTSSAGSGTRAGIRVDASVAGAVTLNHRGVNITASGATSTGLLMASSTSSCNVQVVGTIQGVSGGVSLATGQTSTVRCLVSAYRMVATSGFGFRTTSGSAAGGSLPHLISAQEIIGTTAGIQDDAASPQISNISATIVEASSGPAVLMSASGVMTIVGARLASTLASEPAIRRNTNTGSLVLRGGITLVTGAGGAASITTTAGATTVNLYDQATTANVVVGAGVTVAIGTLLVSASIA